jgi:hypothetical protein
MLGLGETALHAQRETREEVGRALLSAHSFRGAGKPSGSLRPCEPLPRGERKPCVRRSCGGSGRPQPEGKGRRAAP